MKHEWRMGCAIHAQDSGRSDLAKSLSPLTARHELEQGIGMVHRSVAWVTGGQTSVVCARIHRPGACSGPRTDHPRR
ncbi:hypothetical protein EAO70_05135 [Streptomyces sp. adm13(2018)]|nr:hypothetical protein EAO70_05135 [Streptomyces sp. adm13(2018)]